METKKLHIHACGCIHLLDYFCGERPEKNAEEEVDFVTYQYVDMSKPELYCQKCFVSLNEITLELEKMTKPKSC